MTSTARSWVARLRPCVTLDLRSLALFRVGLALTLLLDAALRLGDAGLLYADTGLYPRVLAVTIGDPARLSLHLLNGSPAFATLLTLLQVLAALALLAGWRTRSATAAAWVLAVSASARNPLVLTQADLLLQALLLWGLFLPWQARWSIDRASAPPIDHAHLSWAGAAVLLQILTMLLCAAAADALALPLRAAAGLGVILLLIPRLHARRASIVLLLILCGVGLLWGRERLLFWIGLMLTLALIDGALWERLTRRLTRSEGPGDVRLYPRADLAGGARVLNLLREFLLLPRSQVLSAPASPRVERLLATGGTWLAIDRDDSAHLGNDALRLLLNRALLLRLLGSRLASKLLTSAMLDRWMSRSRPALTHDPDPVSMPFAQHVVAVLAILALVWSLGPLVGIEALPSTPMKLLGLDPHWNFGMRSPQGWLVLVGEHADGSEIDALRDTGAPPDYSRAAELLSSGARNRAYVAALSSGHAQPHLQTLGTRLCTARNQHLGSQAERVVRLRVVKVLPTASGSEATEQRVLWRQDCA